MQTLEATISFLVLLSVLAPVMYAWEPAGVDDSLWRYQLAGDVWRVLYLRGDFHEFNDVWNGTAKNKLHDDCNGITSRTGLCVEFDRTDAGSSNCRGDEEEIASVSRMVYVRGKPSVFILTLKG